MDTNLKKYEVPLKDWHSGWLDEEVGKLLNNRLYTTMLTRERKELNYPCSRQEQIDFLKVKGGYKT